MDYKIKILDSTYNNLSKTKMFTVMVDVPYVLLPNLLEHKELSISYKKIEDIKINEVLENYNNPYLFYNSKNQDLIKTWEQMLKGAKSITTINFDKSSYTIDYNKLCIIDLHNFLTNSYGSSIEIANRLLAPFAYTTCIISGTEWDNFFELRCSKYVDLLEDIYYSKKAYLDRHKFTNKPDGTGERKEALEDTKFWQSINTSTAQPEFQVIAEMLYDLYQEADWKESKYHIPFEDEIRNSQLGGDLVSFSLNNDETFNEDLYYKLLMKVSASMCAKLSYNTQDNEDTLEKHLERADMLIEHKHQEPFSHQAVAMDKDEYKYFYKSMLKKVNSIVGDYKEYGWCYNLRGFISQRYILENF